MLPGELRGCHEITLPKQHLHVYGRDEGELLLIPMLSCKMLGPDNDLGSLAYFPLSQLQPGEKHLACHDPVRMLQQPGQAGCLLAVPLCLLQPVPFIMNTG
ncbi:hypothetical protein D3C73_1377020 [compost metagenome]